MLMQFGNTTFIQHIIHEAKLLSNTKIIVVSGCYHSLLQPILVDEQVESVQNVDWEKGMGSSISAGVAYLNQLYNNVDACFILVCDQPHISISLLNQLSQLKTDSGKGIVVCGYDDTIGTPVLFDAKYFEQLMQLNSQSGAKKIIQQFLNDTATINFPKGAIDIDTPEDYHRLSNS